MFEGVGRFSCAFRRETISFSMFFYLLSITHRFIISFSIFASWINIPLIPQPRMFLFLSDFNFFNFFNGWTIVTSVLSSPKSLESQKLSIVKSISRFHVRLRDWITLRNIFILSISEYLSDLWTAGGPSQFWLCFRLHWRNSIWSHGNGNDRLQLFRQDIPLTRLSRFKLTLPLMLHDY